MNNVSIRNYTKKDYLSLKKNLIEAGMFAETWDSESKLSERIGTKPDSIIVAIIDDDVVGCVYLVDDILPFIFRLAVKRQFRKQGIGKQLMEEAIKRLKKHGHTEIALFADSNNEELKKWYLKQGFKGEKSWICLWKEI